MFANRSVVELIVIGFTAVIVGSVLLTGTWVAIVELRDPTVDTSAVVSSLVSVISAILGALLGLLAGKSESMRTLGTRPDGTADEVPDK